MAFLERILGKKAEELRKRMERSIIVSKKLTDKLDEEIKARKQSDKAMNELTVELKAHRETMEKMLKG